MAKKATKLDPQEILSTLKIASVTKRSVGGWWATGSMAGHKFEALVFEEHASIEGYELAKSRISKLSLVDTSIPKLVTCFDRGCPCVRRSPWFVVVVE